MTTTPIMTVCGSLRAASVHARLLAVAEAEIARLGGQHRRDDTIRTIPHYDEDLDADAPSDIVELRARVGTAAGILIACPAYNGSVTGAVKDWIDWLSRPFGRSALRDSPIAIITASPGANGGGQAAAYLERITASLGAELVAPPLSIPGVADVLDGTEVVDDAVARAISELARSLVDAARPA